MSDNLSEYSASVTVSLENQDYTQAVTAFADTTSSLMSSYNTKQLFIGIAISVGVGLVVALIVTSGMKKQLDGARHNVRAEEYVKGGSLDVKIARDLYLYSTVTRTPKPRNTSTHSSGSGRTHGGGRI